MEKNKALIEITETLCNYLEPMVGGYVQRKIGEDGTVVTKEVWEGLTTKVQKALVLAKYNEVNELYQFSPLYGAYEDIYITITDEEVEGAELEGELEAFAEDVIFREYSDNDIIEMIKHVSISKIDD